MASADPIDDDVDDALRQDSSKRDRASPDPARAEQDESGRYPPAARSADESVRKNATERLKPCYWRSRGSVDTHKIDML